MGFNFKYLPLVKIVLALIAGIFIFNLIAVPFNYCLYSCLFIFILFIVFHFSVSNLSLKKLSAYTAYIIVFLVGGLMAMNKKIENQENHFSKRCAVFAKGVIFQSLEEKDKSYKTVIKINEVIDSLNKAHTATGKLLVYFAKDSLLKNAEIGDEILFKLNYNTVEAPKNPGQFDYKNYLKYKSIFHQQYIGLNQYQIISKHQYLLVKRVSDKIGKYAQSILKQYIPKKENFALADGILLGHRADIDMDLYNAFAYTGILHILSVSGLHVGIIYGMLFFILSIIKDKNKKIRITKFVVITICIWMFTFITGFSAACVRAAILFTLLNYAKNFKENTNNLNLLAGAALLQLLIDPNNLYDIGFQLSYLAMLGLFIFYKPIYALFYHPNKLVDWTWQLWSASLAAQVFTVPLSIYYFGNFPTYFLFANIFAIPLSAVILWLSVALIPLSLIPFLAKLIGIVNSLVISIFIQLTYFFSGLPFGKLFNLYITKWQLVLLFIAVVLLTISIVKQKPKFLMACLSLFLCTILMSFVYNKSEISKNEIILYSVPKNLVIASNVNQQQTIISKDTITEKSFSFCIKNSYRNYRIDSTKNYLLSDSVSDNQLYIGKDMLFINGKSFYLLNHNNTRKAFSTPLKVDYLILSDNCFLNIESVKTNFQYKQLIISSDNDNYHLNIFRKLLNENNIKFVDLSEKALVIE
ncbi:MAG: ComEC/Rec2 family competence protein [Chitinophagales bacterium]